VIHAVRPLTLAAASFAVMALSGTSSLGLVAAVDWWSGTEDDAVLVRGADAEAATSSGPEAAGPVLSQWMRSPACPVRDSFDVVAVAPCATPPPTPALTCDDGSAPVEPLWHRERTTGTGPWGPWDLVTGSWCTAAAGPTPEMVLTELRRLPLPAPALTVQPDRGWVLVNKDTVVYASPSPATFDITLLGVPVHLSATPATYTWDFGDGATTTTISPGHPWPDDDIAHAYTHLGTYQIALTTTWTATYTLGADPTVRTVPGTAATTTTSTPFTVEERRSHLVTDTCTDHPDAPGC